MANIYVFSRQEGAGKTAVCAGLASHWRNSGKRVGYLRLTADGSAGDAAFMKRVLSLKEGADEVSTNAAGLKKAAEKAAASKEVVIIEGPAENAPGSEAVNAIQALKAGVIAVVPYAELASAADIGKAFGANFLGVIYNKVPVSRVERARGEAGAGGVRVLGIIPEDRALLTITVAEMADLVDGELLNSSDRSGELLENFMLGAMVVDSGLEYFGRRDREAAIVRSDRPDMQFAALETDTACLVLTGGGEPPLYNVMEKAQKKDIPVIRSEKDGASVVAAIDDALAGGRFSQEKKIYIITELLRKNADLDTIGKKLGMAG